MTYMINMRDISTEPPKFQGSYPWNKGMVVQEEKIHRFPDAGLMN